MDYMNIVITLDAAYDHYRDMIREKIDSDSPFDSHTRFLVKRMRDTRQAIREFERINNMLPREFHSFPRSGKGNARLIRV